MARHAVAIDGRREVAGSHAARGAGSALRA